MADTHIFFHLGRKELSAISDVFNLSEHTVDTIVNLRRFEDCSECVVRYEEGEGGMGVVRVVAATRVHPRHRPIGSPPPGPAEIF